MVVASELTACTEPVQKPAASTSLVSGTLEFRGPLSVSLYIEQLVSWSAGITTPDSGSAGLGFQYWTLVDGDWEIRIYMLTPFEELPKRYVLPRDERVLYPALKVKSGPPGLAGVYWGVGPDTQMTGDVNISPHQGGALPVDNMVIESNITWRKRVETEPPSMARWTGTFMPAVE